MRGSIAASRSPSAMLKPKTILSLSLSLSPSLHACVASQPSLVIVFIPRSPPPNELREKEIPPSLMPRLASPCTHSLTARPAEDRHTLTS